MVKIKLILPILVRPTILDGKDIGEDGVITVITTRAPVNDDQEEPVVEYITQMPEEVSKEEEQEVHVYYSGSEKSVPENIPHVLL